MDSIEAFLLAMCIVFTAPYLMWRLGKTDYYAPLVVVQIIAGILLGPGAFGTLHPEHYASVFTPSVIQSLNGIAWWGVMLFVWIAGVELDLRQAWLDRRESGSTAALALALPLLLGALAAAGIVRTGPWLGEHAHPWQFVLGVGMACAVTSLPILIVLMEKLDILHQPLGQRILRYASLDDIAIWAVLALILMDWQRVGSQVVFLAVFPLAALACRNLMQAVTRPDRWYFALIWLIASSFAAQLSGLHFIVGAFLSGAVLDKQWFDARHVDLLRHFLLLIVMPVFFLSAGLRTSWTLGGGAVFFVAAILLVVSVSGKLLGTHAVGRMLGWEAGEASIVGWLLQTKALVMLVFSSILLDKHIIASGMFTALLLTALGSTMLTVPVVSPMLKRTKALAGRMA